MALYDALDLAHFSLALKNGTAHNPLFGFRSFELVTANHGLRVTFNTDTMGAPHPDAEILELGVQRPLVGGHEKAMTFLRLRGKGELASLTTQNLCNRFRLFPGRKSSHLLPQPETVRNFFDALLYATGQRSLHWKSSHCPSEPTWDMVGIMSRPNEHECTPSVISDVGYMCVKNNGLQALVKGKVVKTVVGLRNLAPPPTP